MSRAERAHPDDEPVTNDRKEGHPTTAPTLADTSHD